MTSLFIQISKKKNKNLPPPLILEEGGNYGLYETPFLLTTHPNFFVLNFKLGVQINYPLAWLECSSLVL